jgi:hypothetical protein
MALPAPEVMISPGDSTVTAGDSHTVQCTVTDIPYLAVSPTVELIGPGDSVLATDMSFTVTHILDPVMTLHAGQYTCRASVMIASVSVNVSGQSSSTLTVQIVPQPEVDVTLNRTAPLYAWTALTLICTVTLDPNVDNGERVMTEWSGLQDIPEERYSVTGANSSGSTYTGSLTISPLADQDDGTYTCTVTVTGGSNVQQATASDDVTITVMALPAPEVMISPGDSTVTAGVSHTVH